MASHTVDFDKVEQYTTFAKKTLALEYLDEQDLGKFLRALLDGVGGLSSDEKTLVFDNCADELRDRAVLDSVEFYEGLCDCIGPRTIVSMLRRVFLDAEDDGALLPCEFCKVLSNLVSSGSFDLKRAHLYELREHMNPQHLRRLISRLAESLTDDVLSLTKLLRRFFHPTEEYDVAEALLFITKQDWFYDIMPRRKDEASSACKESLYSTFPSCRIVMEEWLDKDDRSEIESDHGSSLDDFIVDDEEEGEHQAINKKKRSLKTQADSEEDEFHSLSDSSPRRPSIRHFFDLAAGESDGMSYSSEEEPKRKRSRNS